MLECGDGEERARAIRSLCPCRSGWDTFEADLALVRDYFKDPDPMVRKAAMHVFEDAFQMKSDGLPTSPRESSNEMIAARRRNRFRQES